jgi:hypothetical protein
VLSAGTIAFAALNADGSRIGILAAGSGNPHVSVFDLMASPPTFEPAPQPEVTLPEPHCCKRTLRVIPCTSPFTVRLEGQSRLGRRPRRMHLRFLPRRILQPISPPHRTEPCLLFGQTPSQKFGVPILV